MRVLVASGPIGALTAAEAAVAIATGWSDADPGSELAVVGLGEAGDGFDEAAAALLDAEVALLPSPADAVVASCVEGGGVLSVSLACGRDGAPWDPAASSVAVGRAIDSALRSSAPPRRLIVDLGDLRAHDGGAGILAGLGARADRPLDEGALALAGIDDLDVAPVRARMRGLEVDVVVPAGEEQQRLLGLRGITSLRGRDAGIDPSSMLAVDAALEGFATALTRAGGDEAKVAAPGSGAAGAAYALLALGARLRTGSAVLGELAGLAETVRAADLIVTGTTTFDFATRGGGVVAQVARWGTDALKPVLLLAGTVLIGAREMRTLGIESAYGVHPGALDQTPNVTAQELITLAARVARSWAA